MPVGWRAGLGRPRERGVNGHPYALWVSFCREDACSRWYETSCRGENVLVVLKGPDWLELRISVVTSWEFRWER